MTPVIRTAIPSDAHAIRNILIGIIDHGGLTALTPDLIDPYVTSKIAEYAETGSFVVAETDRVIGFQYTHPYPGGSSHVLDIATFTDINLRQSGVGRLMMEKTIEIATAKKFHKITARIRGDNTNGIPFYTRSGFRTVGIYKDHTIENGTYIDQVLTERLL